MDHRVPAEQHGLVHNAEITGEPVDSIIAVRDHPDLRYCEVGYCLAQAQLDRGYITEMLTAVSGYILNITDYIFIQVRYDI